MYCERLKLDFDKNGDLKTGEYKILLPMAIVVGVDSFCHPDLILNWTYKFNSGTSKMSHIIFLDDVFNLERNSGYIGEFEYRDKKYFVYFLS